MRNSFLRLFFVGMVFFGLSVALSPASAIANGNVVPNPEKSGVTWNNCSSSLLTNDWIVTAGHCGLFTYSRRLPFETLSVTFEKQKQWADFIVYHPGNDYGLIHLQNGFSMNSSTAGYIRGIYTGTSDELMGKTLLHQGRGGDEILREANAIPVSYDEYKFALNYPGGEYSVPGDSGSPIYTTGNAGSVLVGVNQNGQFSRPEFTREWTLDYIYNREISFPKTWNVYDSEYPAFFDSPLRNNYVNAMSEETAWDPCPRSPFSYTIKYSLEPNADYIYIYGQGEVITLNGWEKTYSAEGYGPMRFSISTNDSVRSPGIQDMKVRCNSPVLQKANTNKLSLPWSNPLPSRFYDNKDLPTMCGGQSYSWQADYQFAQGDGGEINGQSLTGTGTAQGLVSSGKDLPVKVWAYSSSDSLPGEFKVFPIEWPSPFLPANFSAQKDIDPMCWRSYEWRAFYNFFEGDHGVVNGQPLIGYGMATGTAVGALKVEAYTTSVNSSSTMQSYSTGITHLMIKCPTSLEATESKSSGFTSIRTTCSPDKAKIICHGPECFTLPSAVLPNSQRATTKWNPCRGGAFSWYASYDLQYAKDRFIVSQPGEYSKVLTGKGEIGPITGYGVMDLSLITDMSVNSVGLKELRAVCEDWE